MNIQAPFGGKKQSGIGREFGEYVGYFPTDWYSGRLLTLFPGTSCVHRAEDYTDQVSGPESAVRYSTDTT
jgi:hypothetical protein